MIVVEELLHSKKKSIQIKFTVDSFLFGSSVILTTEVHAAHELLILSTGIDKA